MPVSRRRFDAVRARCEDLAEKLEEAARSERLAYRIAECATRQFDDIKTIVAAHIVASERAGLTELPAGLRQQLAAAHIDLTVELDQCAKALDRRRNKAPGGAS